VPILGDLNDFADEATVEVAEEVIAEVIVIFIRPRTLIGFRGHFAAWIPRYLDDIQSVFS
jgi:hypothetical protein